MGTDDKVRLDDDAADLAETALTAIAIWVFVFALFFLSIWACREALGHEGLHSTWPESMEFSQLDAGQERFSEHATNIDGVTVLVDHETGAQYVRDGDGMTALLDVDGTPLLVAEAGS